jgi:hypothetical protein
MMIRDAFSKKFDTLQQTIATLQQRIGAEPLQPTEDLTEIMEALQTALRNCRWRMRNCASSRKTSS